MRKIPKLLKGVLWSADISKLDLEKDKPYIVNQVLSYGTLADIGWLLAEYGPKATREVFLKYPQKVYTKAGFAFTKNAVLDLRGADIGEDRYVQAFY